MSVHRFLKPVGLTALILTGFILLTTSSCRPSMGRDHSDRILSHMDRKVAHLDLDADQERKYQALREKIRSEMRLNYEARIAATLRVKEEFARENPDVKALSQFVKERIKSRSAFMEQTPDYFAEFYAILKPEQQREVRDWIRDRLEDFEPEANEG